MFRHCATSDARYSESVTISKPKKVNLAVEGGQQVNAPSHALRKKPVARLSNNKSRNLLNLPSKFKAICARDSNSRSFFRGQNLSAHANIFPRTPMSSNILIAMANTISRFSNRAACFNRPPSNRRLWQAGGILPFYLHSSEYSTA
jgi:hypothetical protein